MTKRKKLKDFFVSTQFILGLALIFFSGLLIYGNNIKEYLELSEDFHSKLEQLLIILTATVGIHLLNQKLLASDLENRFYGLVSKSINDSNLLLRNSDLSGVKAVHLSRTDIEKDIENLISNAKERIWISGASLSAEISLQELIPKLRNQLEHHCDVKILLHNPISRTALFRGLLESDPGDIPKIINPTNVTENHSYFTMPLYGRFNTVFTSLSSTIRNKDLLKTVRFYDQLPSHWLIIVDGIAYYQPYVLENKQKQDSSCDDCAYTPMPILEFSELSNGSMFDNLVKHFSTLYQTSNVDFFYMQVLNESRQSLLQKIYKENKPWLKHMKYALSCAKERRKHIRQKCMLLKTSMMVKWKGGESRIKKIFDYSEDGMSLVLENDFNGDLNDNIMLVFDLSKMTETEEPLIRTLEAITSKTSFKIIRIPHARKNHLAIARINMQEGTS